MKLTKEQIELVKELLSVSAEFYTTESVLYQDQGTRVSVDLDRQLELIKRASEINKELGL